MCFDVVGMTPKYLLCICVFICVVSPHTNDVAGPWSRNTSYQTTLVLTLFRMYCSKKHSTNLFIFVSKCKICTFWEGFFITSVFLSCLLKTNVITIFSSLVGAVKIFSKKKYHLQREKIHLSRVNAQSSVFYTGCSAATSGQHSSRNDNCDNCNIFLLEILLRTKI